MTSQKIRRTKRKHVPNQHGTLCEDFMEQEHHHRSPVDRTSEGTEKKYFIMVEETSSKGTENLIFLVEEKPLQANQELKKGLKGSKQKISKKANQHSISHNKRLSKSKLISGNEINGDNTTNTSSDNLTTDCDTELYKVELRVVRFTFLHIDCFHDLKKY